MSQGKLHGEVLHIDAFGNLVSNIDQRELLRFSKGRPIAARIGRRNILGLKKGYWEGKKDEPMVLIGSGGLLEIAVREGNAQKRLEVRRGDKITISL
jgi:S-adenosylmethionine hydrolase